MFLCYDVTLIQRSSVHVQHMCSIKTTTHCDCRPSLLARRPSTASPRASVHGLLYNC